jgi:cell division protein FtsL
VIRRYVLFYFFVLTIPLILGIAAWQSVRYTELERKVRHLEAIQQDWVESNKKIIASIAVLSSVKRIEQVAIYDLRLSRIQPEDVIQVYIEGRQ